MITPDWKEGEAAFLRLDNFDPSWREAVVVVASPRLDRLVLVVRVTDTELAEQGDNVTSFSEKSKSFILVEGRPSQMRKECPQSFLKLDVKRNALLKAGKTALEGDNPQYLTASEEPREESKQDKKGRDSESESSSQSDDASSDEEDDILNLLAAAQKKKKKPEKGIGGDVTKKGRYPLLAKPKKSGKTDAVDLIMSQMKKGQCLPDSSISALVNLEMLKMLKGRKSSKSHVSSDESDDTDSSLSASDSSKDGKLKGAGRALRDFRAGHRRMKKHPVKHIRKYIKEVEGVLGVAGSAPYRLSDYTRRLNWGKQRSLLRTHFALSEILQVLMKGKTERAALMVVQLLRALHQVSLDQGSWQAVLSHVDPLEKPKFGGEPDQLERIASYLKAMGDLEKRSQSAVREDPAPPKGQGKSKGKKTKDEDAEQ